MGSVAIGFKQIYVGVKTIFGRGGTKVAQAAKQKVPVYNGPSLIDIAKKQPLALPAPTAEQIAAELPRVCVPKALNGLNASELRMSQMITKDGTHVRYFRGPNNDRVLLRMEDKGILHKEWINPGAENFTYIKSTGGGDRYILKKDGNFTQIEKQAVKYKDGINQKISKNDQYYSDYNGTGFHRQESKGFNGTKKTEYEARGTADGYTYINNQRTTEPVKYHIKSEGRFRTDQSPSGEMSLNGIYNRVGEDAHHKAYTQLSDLKKIADEKFVSDFDEVLFNPYRNA